MNTGWAAVREQCFAALAMRPDPARGWWAAIGPDVRRAVLTAAGVSQEYAGAAWDSMTDSARSKIRPHHDKRRSMWVRLNAEFAGRVSE